ncbi:Gfo/Idh/MocA family oxidoreductase, partial [Thioclava sp. BHET1]
MIGIGIAGYGYWGPNMARAVSEAEETELVAIADRSHEALARAGRRYPAAKLVADCMEMIADPAVDAVVIATPVVSHYPLALAALRAGKHVLIEKPMTDNPAHAAHLVEEAAARRLTLMVDHTFCYTPAVQKIASLIENGEIGDVYYYDSTRVNLGLFRHDVDVIWDLAVHDFAILDFLLKDKP